MKKKIPVDIFHKRGCTVTSAEPTLPLCVDETLRNGYEEGMLVTAHINTVFPPICWFLSHENAVE